jgi:hypothetical protein
MRVPAPSDHFQDSRRRPIPQPNLTKMRSGVIRSLHEWWLAQRDDDIPDRAALRPEELKPMLPYMLVSEVVHNPFRIRYRLAGTVVAAVTGMDVTGRYLHELVPSDDEALDGSLHVRLQDSRAGIRDNLADVDRTRALSL